MIQLSKPANGHYSIKSSLKIIKIIFNPKYISTAEKIATVFRNTGNPFLDKAGSLPRSMNKLVALSKNDWVNAIKVGLASL